MTVLLKADLQTAVVIRLRDGLGAAGEGGAAVPVYDSVREQGAARQLVIFDQHTTEAAGVKDCEAALHEFTLNVIDAPREGARGRRGQAECKRLVGEVYRLLHHWAPLDGRPCIRVTDTDQQAE